MSRNVLDFLPSHHPVPPSKEKEKIKKEGVLTLLLNTALLRKG
jgi:hypothetical protein